MKKYPKQVQKHIDYLNRYEDNNHADEFNIIHMYPKELAYPNGYYDSMFFDLHCFNTYTMQKRIIKKRDGIRFINNEEIKTIRIFADGSTIIVFKQPVKLFILQNVWIEKSTEENK